MIAMSVSDAGETDILEIHGYLYGTRQVAWQLLIIKVI